MLTAIGTGQSPGLGNAISTAFNQFRAARNATDGGSALFGESQTHSPPFRPNSLAETLSTPASAAFASDGVEASARLSGGLNLTYGVTAGEIDSGVYSVFQTLAGAGTIGDPPTAGQPDLLLKAAEEIETGLSGLRNVNAENGRKQGQVDTMSTRAT